MNFRPLAGGPKSLPRGGPKKTACPAAFGPKNHKTLMTMTTKLKYLAGVALVIWATACKESDVFYSTSYDIVKAEVRITTQAPETPGEETAPSVQEFELPAGGSYRLDYTRYDGGPLKVRTSADGPEYAGVFLRTPGSSRITFIYDGKEHAYKLSTYSTADGTRCTLLTADLTDYYRALYPTAHILQAERNEYTTHKE